MRNKTPKWVVTRQCYWPDSRNVVEIAAGGLDYANPDMLSPKYAGEGNEYHDPVEAVDAAWKILRKWRAEGGKGVRLAHGYTGGMTVPFDSCTLREARQWAAEKLEELPKCAMCGEIRAESWGPFDSDRECCSEYCAEKYYRFEEEPE